MMKSVAGVFGAMAIACGAFGAHALKGKVDGPMLDVWQTAANYHLAHSIAMLAALAMEKGAPGKQQSNNAAVKLFMVGTILFSGSLYMLVLTGIKKIGMITPIGGLTLMAGWLALLF